MISDENEIKKAYREWIDSEVRSPLVRREKKEFIRAHFENPPVWLMRPAFAFPAVGLCAAIALLLMLRPLPVESPQVAKVVPSAAEEITAALPGEPGVSEMAPGISEQPPVTVTRVRSEVGPTMVYQRIDHDVPIVIVWVFAGQ